MTRHVLRYRFSKVMGAKKEKKNSTTNYLCVCAHANVCARENVCMCVCARAQMCVCARMNISLSLYVTHSVRWWVGVGVGGRAGGCVQDTTRTHTHTHTRAHTHTHRMR